MKNFLQGLSVAILLAALPASATYSLEPRIRVADSLAQDAFGRLRVSTVTSQVQIEQLTDKNPALIDEELFGTGLATFQANEASTLLTTAAANDFVIQQTFSHGHYQAGKSQTIKMTFANLIAETNIIKRVGYFHCNTTTPFNSSCDGIWLSSEGGTYYVNVYRSGTAVTRVARSSWDDPLDGTGPSGMNINWTNAQILTMDFQWLGVGRVRFNIAKNGQIVTFHTAEHANSVTKPFMTSPNQTLRWEIRQDGAGSGTLRSICGEIGTEGSWDSVGASHSVTNLATGISGSAGTKYALVGLTLQSDDEMQPIIPQAIEVLVTGTNKEFAWQLCRNPTVAGVFTYSAVTNSPASVAIGVASNTVSDCTSTDGKLIDSGHGNSAASIVRAIKNARTVGVDINGVTDKIVLVVQPLDTQVMYGSLTWEERF